MVTYTKTSWSSPLDLPWTSKTRMECHLNGRSISNHFYMKTYNLKYKQSF